MSAGRSADASRAQAGFESFRLSPPTRAALVELGFTTPTEIQAAAIPPALEGQPVVGQAATGTGKTLAYLIPVVEHLAARPASRALVVAPTRELASQIAVHARVLLRHHHLRSVVLTGGSAVEAQETRIATTQLWIGTPGRLLDLHRRAVLPLDQVSVAVVDEVDRLVDLGFFPDVRRLLSAVPRSAQLLVFSATVDGMVWDVVVGRGRRPVRAEVSPPGVPPPAIDERMVEVDPRDRTPALLWALSTSTGPAVVFTSTRHRAQKVVKALDREGIAAAELHAGRSTAGRISALDAFRQGEVRVLVATDLAARGLDIEGVALVVNDGLPHQPEDYPHRIGRTGRAGATGTAITLFTTKESGRLPQIQAIVRRPLVRAVIPADDPVFTAAVKADRARQADPGPTPPPVPARPAGQPIGRHARTHRRR